MSADRIKGPSLRQQQALQQFQRVRSEQTQRRDPAESAPQDSPDAVSGAQGEKLEISSQARRLDELRGLVQAGREALAAEPEVREQKVAAARRLLAAGGQDTAEARDLTARRLTPVLAGLHRLLE